MSQTFRDWEPDQVWLLAPSPQNPVPAGHVSHLVRSKRMDAIRRRNEHRVARSPAGLPAGRA